MAGNPDTDPLPPLEELLVSHVAGVKWSVNFSSRYASFLPTANL